ncbi:sugar ABC transporter substrate-binding protein [Streptomyces neyagawaensis]|uniref:sugar ABC transporter substrate-binding protein n=1 Tax=Streptomyces neyagawaensis TaxID=42238 RepID=UPI0006E449EE|nr:substrate-binding domain-containing protein [Streptomyces neyagawaensis]MCL6732271.1 substrate-binding domain-containing protein [Streptomyces neyagawaensis]MDE1685751.1 substrate-binding domain-containing protein [Streptomyces neyagawaensis]
MVRNRGLGVLAAFAVMVMALLSACSTTPTPTAASASSGSKNDEATKALAAAYKGVTGTPPTVPTKPRAGVSLWVVSCGQQVPSCSTPVAGVQKAAKAVGWKVKMCDGQLNPTGWGNCIRQAASAKADVVIPVGIDCVAVQAPMQEAVKAGTKIIGGGGSDCDAAGGKKLMASERLELPDTTIEQYWKLNGKLQADWLIGKTGAKAQVLLLNFTDPIWGPWITAGFEAELKTCADCKIVQKLDLSNNDVVTNTMAQKFSSALLKNPSVNAVSIPVGGWMQAGLSQAVQSSGRAAKLNVSSGFGDASTMDLIRDSGFAFGAMGYASQWGSYGSVDTAIRILNGEKPQVQGDGFQMVDKDKNLPASGDYQGGVDYKSQYRKLWGLS